MDWYLLSKFLHVGFATVWLGGALIMVILGAAAERANDEADLVGTVRKVAWAAERVYVPASILTLVFGLLATWLGALWTQLFVILGLAGIIVTIALGILVLTPRAKQVEAGFKAGGVTPRVVATCREILTIAKFDMVLLFTILAVMVLKPTPASWIVLAVMAVVIVVAGLVFLSPLRRSSTAVA